MGKRDGRRSTVRAKSYGKKEEDEKTEQQRKRQEDKQRKAMGMEEDGRAQTSEEERAEDVKDLEEWEQDSEG